MRRRARHIQQPRSDDLRATLDEIKKLSICSWALSARGITPAKLRQILEWREAPPHDRGKR